MMGEIRRRAEKEAKRKLESGQLGSGPGGKSPVKVSGLWSSAASFRFEDAAECLS